MLANSRENIAAKRAHLYPSCMWPTYGGDYGAVLAWPKPSELIEGRAVDAV